MKKLIILLTLVTVSFSADKWGVGKPANEGYILYPTISYTVTNGELSYYRDGELWETSDWANEDRGGDGKFGKETNFNMILPVTKNFSLIYNSNKVAKHPTIYHNDYGKTQQGGKSYDRAESWKKTTLGLKVSFSPDMFNKYGKLGR